MGDKGIIFNIQKFSIHDGPGIRTTIFLKGCPLRCKWCSNPESQAFNIQVTWDSKKCIHCLTCVKACKEQVITHTENKIHINQKEINNCLDVVKLCPTQALKQEGETKSIQEIVAICLQDIDFYEESKGGITISGGEGMSQPEFLKELVPALKQEGLHLAIETTGYIPTKTFQELAPLFDLLLFDVKHYDSTVHKLGTGVNNALIIENLKWAIQNNIEVLPRIPVIPNFNNTIEDAINIANLLADVGATNVQLLPFHQFGEKKYELLNITYELKELPALHPEDLTDYQNVFIERGIHCFF